jgi:hypothetical protein
MRHNGLNGNHVILYGKGFLKYIYLENLSMRTSELRVAKFSGDAFYWDYSFGIRQVIAMHPEVLC